MIDVPVVLAEGASLPEYATAGAAGADLRSTIGFDLAPGERRLVPTGIRMALPDGYEAQIRPRSGLALRHGIAMVNAPGTIDPDYRGEIGVLLINLGADVVTFVPGDRIGQMVVCPVVRARFGETTSLDGTVRGEGGFGSTGTD